MKKLFAIVTMFTVFQASAAQLIQHEKGRVSCGSISAQGATDLSSLKKELSEEADKKGASYYRITSAGGNNLMTGTAEIYP